VQGSVQVQGSALETVPGSAQVPVQVPARDWGPELGPAQAQAGWNPLATAMRCRRHRCRRPPAGP